MKCCNTCCPAVPDKDKPDVRTFSFLQPYNPFRSQHLTGHRTLLTCDHDARGIKTLLHLAIVLDLKIEVPDGVGNRGFHLAAPEGGRESAGHAIQAR